MKPQFERLDPIPARPLPPKPAVKSKTNQSAFIIFLAAVWQPLVVLIGAALEFFGVHVDVQAWVPLLDDGALDRADVIVMVRDLVMAGFAFAIVYFRSSAIQSISGIFKVKNNE